MRRSFFIVIAAIGLLIAVPLVSLAGAEQSASQFQEFDASVGQPGAVKDNPSPVSDTNGKALPATPTASTAAAGQAAPTPKPEVARSAHEAAKAPQGLGSTLRNIISYLRPSQAELDSVLQDQISPRDRADSRPGPHWKMRPK
ncbi:MAG: hypothetical protein P8182_18130 [Deltaproteobacteria bacterium]